MSVTARVPVLTWHSLEMAGPGYVENQHIALREDLEALHRLGLKVIPLREIARALVEGRLEGLRGCVGLSFDDATDFDFHDVPHHLLGPQRGMANILADFRARHGIAAQPRLHATSFAIVSPAARAELDRTCMVGCGWWNDDWWPAAEAGGLLAIESHGWDHNHDSLADTVAHAPKGAFDITTRADADAEIARASRELRRLRAREGDVLFAYPYGVANHFLAGEYLPDVAVDHGVYAAFTTDAAPVTPASSRYAMPRWVSGSHWKSPEELARLLAEAGCVPVGARPAPDEPSKPAPRSRGEALRTWEVSDATRLAGDLFTRRFDAPVPETPRHFVLVFSPPAGEGAQPQVVAYAHSDGRACADEGVAARLTPALRRQVELEGGLAAIVAREGEAMRAAAR